MAFEKNKTINGHTNNYWRLLGITIGINENDAHCVFGLYKDKATRDANKYDIVKKVRFNLNSELLNSSGNSDTIKNINTAKAYTALKTRAVAEEAKTENKNTELSYFNDATTV